MKIEIKKARIIWAFGNSNKSDKMEFVDGNDREKILDLLQGCVASLEKRAFAMFSAKVKGGHICIYYNPKSQRSLNINLSATIPKKKGRE